MSTKQEILTPVGRLVQGSLYNPNTTDAEGRPLIYKTGANAGQPRVDYYFGLAIAKQGEQHWSQTEWGAKIYNVGVASFPNGQTQSPQFAWKITDGDSQIPNSNGVKPCDKEGYAGHWVLNFSCAFAPGIYNERGDKTIPEPNAVLPGDYIQVYGDLLGNGSTQQPGVYLNHRMVAFVRYGDRISSGIDAKSVGFGVNTVIPAGARTTPPAGNFNPAPAPSFVPPVPAQQAYVPPTPVVPVTAPQPVVPYPQIMTPPAHAPKHVMTAAAQGNSYESLIGVGWTDAMLIRDGLMLA